MSFVDGSGALVDILVDEAALATRVDALGSEIGAAYRDDRVPVLVSVLKGATLFLSDLVRATSCDLEVDFMSISSYGQSGVVKIVKDLDADIGGRHVLIVEDIVDTGLTLNYLKKTLSQRDPASLRTVTLLDKHARRIAPVALEWVGFEIPDVFVVGYGLDFQGLYRNVGQILAVRDLPRLANDPRLLVGPLFGKGR